MIFVIRLNKKEWHKNKERQWTDHKSYFILFYFSFFIVVWLHLNFQDNHRDLLYTSILPSFEYIIHHKPSPLVESIINIDNIPNLMDHRQPPFFLSTILIISYSYRFIIINHGLPWFFFCISYCHWIGISFRGSFFFRIFHRYLYNIYISKEKKKDTPPRICCI